LPRAALSPYTTLFRSGPRRGRDGGPFPAGPPAAGPGAAAPEIRGAFLHPAAAAPPKATDGADRAGQRLRARGRALQPLLLRPPPDRKSTRLNSSHVKI